MSAPLNRPCENWPLAVGCKDFSDVDADLLEALTAEATEILWVLTGRRFGLCEHTVRPCRRGCRPGDMDAFPHLAQWGVGAWSMLPVACCRRNNCGCTQLQQVGLPGPVAEVSEVLVDGVILDPSSYRVDQWRYLVRRDGQCWPACQDYSLDADQPGTWQITYTRGRPVPPVAMRAMEGLIGELVKVCRMDPNCSLPRNAAQVTRQGVQVRLQGRDATALYQVGSDITNAIIEFVPEVAIALRILNPTKLTAPAVVYRPDAMPSGRHTGT